MGDKNSTTKAKEFLEGGGFPVYRDITDTVKVLAVMAEYSDYLRNCNRRS